MTWLILLLLTLLLGFYVASEFAAVSVRQSRIQQRAEEGSAAARRLLPILDDPHRLDDYIAASQIGITLTSLIAGAYAQSRLAPELLPLFERVGGLKQAAAQSVAAVVVLVGLTVFQMVLGELVPKSLALQAPTRVALATVLPMQWSLRLMRWFIRFLNGSGALLLRLMGVAPAGHRHVHSPEEIEYLVSESGKGGLLKPSEQLRLRNALQLGQRLARDLMVPRTSIEALQADAPQSEVLRLAIESPYTRLPVYERSIDHIVGVVHVKDLLRLIVASAPLTADGARPMPVVPETAPLDQVLSTMRAERTHMALVVDEHGGVAGLVTLEDLVEEVVGDIRDDEDEPLEIRTDESGIVRVLGTVRLDALGERLGTALDHPDVDSVSGLVLTLLGRPARVRDAVTFGGYRFEVTALHGFGVGECAVQPLAERPSAASD